MNRWMIVFLITAVIVTGVVCLALSGSRRPTTTTTAHPSISVSDTVVDAGEQQAGEEQADDAEVDVPPDPLLSVQQQPLQPLPHEPNDAKTAASTTPRWRKIFETVTEKVSGSITGSLISWKQREYRKAAHYDADPHHVRITYHDQPLTIHYLDRVRSRTADRRELVVLVHGFAGDKDTWSFFTRYLSQQRYRVVAFDLHGFGDSTKPLTDVYDTKSQTERLALCIDALRLPPEQQRFHIVGHSMGGNIAGRYAIMYPSKVKSLLLMSALGVVSPNLSEVWVSVLHQGQNPLLPKTINEFEHMLALSFVDVPKVPSFIVRYLAEQMIRNRPFHELVFQQLLQKPDNLQSDLHLLRNTPTLILWGDTDRIIDVSTAHVFHRHIPGSKMFVLNRCGHSPTIEKPKEAVNAYLSFLHQIS